MPIKRIESVEPFAFPPGGISAWVQASGGGGGDPPVVEIGPEYGEPIHSILFTVDPILLETELVAIDLTLSVAPLLAETFIVPVTLTLSADPLLQEIEYAAISLTLSVAFASGIVTAPTKDVWTPTVAACPDNANKDGSPLRVSGTAGATSDGYIGFDMAALGSQTINSAKLILWVTTAPATSQTINTFKLTNANETWSETTMTCSNRVPADGASVQNFTSGTAAGVWRVITLNSSWISRLQDRLGVGVASFLLQNASGNVLTTEFETKDRSDRRCYQQNVVGTLNQGGSGVDPSHDFDHPVVAQ
jgi:hypothetical protein